MTVPPDADPAAPAASGPRARPPAAAAPPLVWTALPDGAIALGGEHGGTAPDWLAWLHPEDRPRWQAAWRAALAAGQGFALELRLRRPGQEGWRRHLVAAGPLRDAAGGIVRWCGTAADVEVQAAAEAAVRAETLDLGRRAGALLEVMRTGLLTPDGIMTATRRITEVAAHTLDVARASLWTLAAEGEVLICRDRFDARTGTHEAGAEVALAAVPAYRQALAETGVIVAAAAAADPRLAGLAEPGIGATLEAPILAEGRLAGVFRLEHAGGPRAWSEADRTFALAVAALVALGLEQAARTESEYRLRAILESEPECVSIVSPAGLVLEMNPAGLALLEAEDCAAVRGRPVAGFVHPDDRAAYLALHRRTAAGEGGQLRYRVLGLKGTERWMETHTAPLRRADGTIEAVLAVARDITARRRAEEALIESRRHLSMILETVGEGVHGLDAEGRILFDNPAALAMLGWSAEEMGGRHSHPLIQPRRADGSPYPLTESPIWQSLRDGRTRRVDDEVFFRKDGSSFPVEYVCAPMKRADGTIAGAVVTFRDITDRARAERLRRAEAEIFDLISAGAALAEVLERIARALDAALAPARSVILLAEEGGRFRLGAAPQLGDFAAALDGATIGPELGPCGAAVAARRRVVAADLEAIACAAELSAAARRHGLRAAWATPALDAEGRPLACVTLYYESVRAPAEEEMQATERAAQLVAIAIQRVRSLEALRASEATFRETFRDAAIGIAVVGTDGLIQEVNAAFARILGYDRPEELRGIDLETLTPAEDLEAVRPLRAELLAGKRDSYVREKRYRTRRGGLVWVRNSVAMRRDAAGRAINAIVVTEDITPQKAAEQELRQSQALLQVASRMGQLGGWEVRLPDRESRWSDEVSRIFGLPPGRVLAVEEALAAFVPADRARLEAAFEACAAEGTPWDLELELLAADGRRVWVRSIGEAVRNGAGRIVAVHGALQDISERREAEARLRESESRFHAVARVTTDVIWDWDLRTGRLWWSEGFETAFGWRLAELEPDIAAWLHRIHPEDRDRVEAGLRRVIATRGSVWADEYRFLRGDGTVAEVEDRGTLILDPAGEPVRFVGGMRDITERKRAQRDLRERIKELRCLYRVQELTGDAGRPLEAICEEIAGFLPASLAQEQHAVARIVVEGREYRSADWQAAAQAVRRPIVVEGKEIGMVEIGHRIALPDVPGRLSPFLAEELALVDAVAGHIGRMIQDRRMAETLRQADRLRAVGELTGGIAHDFNNLLTVILGNAELLTDRLADDAEGRTLALTALAAAESAAELTRRLLAFSRRQTLEPRATDVGRLVRGMRGLLSRTIGEHIEVRISEQEGLWPAMIDPPQLESAILNLCINARDAMPAGGRLTIEVANAELDAAYAERQPEVEPGAYVMVAVSDTGIGMTPEVLARAFDPFFTTKEVGRGSGLGLSMVWGFVKQSRGHVAIYSEPGLGTTVRLYLPRAAEAAQAPPPRAEPLPRGSERILLVEDDALVRAHVEGQLRELGYQVVSVGDGQAALAALAHGPDFDLLFTDIVMPGGMSGRDLAEEARRRRPGLRVLFTSGYTEEAMLHQGHLPPGVRLLAKPYRRDELARRVREALACARVTPSSSD